MSNIFTALGKSYSARCADRAAALGAWRDFAGAFPPDLTAYRDGSSLPSAMAALEAGDLGLAILWIVQATLVRAFAKDLADEARSPLPFLSSITPVEIGALAHSEDRDFPVYIHEEGGNIIITGRKKYITGGLQADLVMVTARWRGSEKTDALLCLPRSLLPEASLVDLSLPMLRTTSHASLSLEGFAVPRENLITTGPGALRRCLKRWGLAERSLMMESYISAEMHLAGKLLALGLCDSDMLVRIEDLLRAQRTATRTVLSAALAGERVPTEGADIFQVLAVFKELEAIVKEADNSGTSELSMRLDDLSLLASLKK